MFQLLLIGTSFTILMEMESETISYAGSINVAGLNRFLTSSILVEILQTTYIPKIDNLKTVEHLQNNIELLKNGGSSEEGDIGRLAFEFNGGLNIVEQDFEKLRNTIIMFEGKNTEDVKGEITRDASNLFVSSDKLVSKITMISEQRQLFLVKLEIILLVVNVIIHISLLILIFRILTREGQEKIKLERFATIGKIGASIAHDLRNPLTVIKGASDIIQLNMISINEAEKKQFEKIDTAIQKIEYLTRDVLDFSNIREIKKEKVQLLQVINEAIKETEIPDRIEIILPTKDYSIHVDKIKIQTVITNLIKNSIDAISGNGKIEFKLDESNDYISIIIKDSGKGISPKELSKVFEPLYTTKQTGTGLGLSNCKRIIEQHGGKISVKINPTTFIILLPKN